MLWDVVHRLLAALWTTGLVFVLASFETPPARAADTASQMPFEAPPVRDLADIPAALDDTDATATLEGIRIALSEVADGSTYVWHRRDGRLSGMAQPTTSFRDPAGQPCRHLILMLNTPQRSGKVEGIACRTADQRWHLAG